MATTPLLTATPGNPVTYNPSMADTFSWVPIEGAGRPLFARATYLANASDIGISLSAGDINVNLADVEVKLDTVITKLNQQLGQNGFVYIDGTAPIGGNFTTIEVVSACKISALTATNSTFGNLSSIELPATFSLSGPILGIQLLYGSVLAYKA